MIDGLYGNHLALNSLGAAMDTASRQVTAGIMTAGAPGGSGADRGGAVAPPSDAICPPAAACPAPPADAGQVLAARLPDADMIQAMAKTVVIKHRYAANIAVIKNRDETHGTVLDIVAG